MESATILSSRPSRWLLIAALAGCLMAVACTGTGAVISTDEPDESTEQPEERTEPVTRTVQGFRIQILSTPEKDEADQRLAEAMDWWSDVPPSQRPQYLTSSQLPIDVKYQQPYYRVRLGNFASRAEADGALSTIRERYPDAFIVPDTVTITR